MSLEKFVTEGGEKRTYNKLQATPESVKEELKIEWFSDDMPNQPPIIAVDERIAIDVGYIDDEEFATELAKKLGFRNTEDISFAIRVTYNDLATWHWPFKEIRGSKHSPLMSFLREKVKDIKKWEDIINDREPQDEYEVFDEYSGGEVDWAELLETDGNNEGYNNEQKRKDDEEESYTWQEW